MTTQCLTLPLESVRGYALNSRGTTFPSERLQLNSVQGKRLSSEDVFHQCAKLHGLFRQKDHQSKMFPLSLLDVESEGLFKRPIAGVYGAPGVQCQHWIGDNDLRYCF